MLKRLGNVAFWLGNICALITICFGIGMFFVMISSFNQTDIKSAPLVGGLIVVASIIPFLIGKAVRYVLSGD